MTRWRPRLLPLAILAMAGLLLTRGLLLHEGFGTPAAAQAPAPETSAPEAPAAQAPAAPEGPPDEIQAAERALLESLRERRLALEAREAETAQREMLLAAAERRLAARIEQLSTLQQRLETETAAQDERAEQRLRQLVRLYEAMRPRDASAIFNDLDMEVLLPVLARMREARAAPILAAMQPDRARQATTELARLRARLAPSP